MNGSENHSGVATPETQETPAPAASHPETPTSAPRGGVPPRTLTRERFQPFDPRRKSPIVASVLSLMPGLGQVYVGYYKVGFIHVAIVAGIIALLNTASNDVIPFFGFFLPFFWLYNIIDAGRRAALYNLALEGGKAVDLPGAIPEPSMGGKLIAGIILIGGGLVFLSNTLFGYSLQWIEAWWPVAPILVGVVLVIRWMMDKTQEKDVPTKSTEALD